MDADEFDRKNASLQSQLAEAKEKCGEHVESKRQSAVAAGILEELTTSRPGHYQDAVCLLSHAQQRQGLIVVDGKTSHFIEYAFGESWRMDQDLIAL